MTARACAVREPGLHLPCGLKVAQPSWLWLPQVTGWKPVPPSDIDAKWAISPHRNTAASIRPEVSLSERHSELSPAFRG